MMSTVIPRNDLTEVYEWLREQAVKLELHISLLTEEAVIRSGWLYLPVHIEGVTDAYDNALKLQSLEDTWNDRELRPEPPLFLIPAKDPLRQAAWERVSNALQRKLKALEAFGNATSREEQEKAASEFQSAEQAERDVHQAYEKIMPQNGYGP